MSVAGVLGVVALGAGAVAAGAVAGNTLERRTVGASRQGPDAEQDEPFGRLPADRWRTVRTDDGVELYVEEVGQPDAPLTVVMVHGLANSMGCWHYQRRDLTPVTESDLRMVLYDHRGHGRSGRGEPNRATLEQLAEDLLLVLEETCPTGPVVLLGHSMGGMTVQEFLALRPDLLDGRIVGVGLYSTSAGKVAETFIGPAAAAGRAIPPPVGRQLAASPGLRTGGAVIDSGRRAGSDLSYELTRRFSFGGSDVSPSLVEYVAATIEDVPVEVVLELVPALLAHEREDALNVLEQIPAMVLCGDADRVTPLSHSRLIAERLPDSTFVSVAGAGHMAHMERPGYVTLRTRAFLRQVARRQGLMEWRGAVQPGG